MALKTAAYIFARSIAAIHEDMAGGKSKIGAIFKGIASHPLKVLASFIFAPVLLVKVAFKARNPIRRLIAVVGLLISLILSYLAATFLGSLLGALFIATEISILIAIGFIFGTTFSIYFSVIFSIIVFNIVSFICLKLNSQEILDYLNELST